MDGHRTWTAESDGNWVSSMSSSTRPKRRIRHGSTNNLHAIAATAAAAVNESSQWACLHMDLVELIGWRVLAGDMLDYVRFRAVCKNWRSRTVCPRGRGVTDPRFHPRRWMMLPEGHGLHPGHGKLRGYIRFFNLSTGTIIRVRLPLFKNHCVLDSVDGILVLQRDHDTAIRLLHPFTGDITEFPPLETLLEHVDPNVDEERKLPSLRKVRCASISVSNGGIITVMMLLSGVLTTVFANSGDQLWRVSEGLGCPRYIAQSFQGKIYKMHRPIASSAMCILQIDPPQQHNPDDSLSRPTEKLVATFPPSPGLFFSLVECNSEVLLLTMDRPNQPNSFYRLADLIMKRVVPLTSVGDNSLFMGYKRLCVSAKAFPSIVGDTCVFEQRVNESRLAQYDFRRGTVSPASDGAFYGGHIARPTTIIYHIYTCCFPRLWNKGLMMHQGEASSKLEGEAKVARWGVELIGWQVLAGNLPDYVRFELCAKNGGRCAHEAVTSWTRFHPQQWMLLPERPQPPPPAIASCRFFDLSIGTIVRVRLPLFKNHCVLDSVDGILVLQRDHEEGMKGDAAKTLIEHVDPDVHEEGMLPSLRKVRCSSISVSSGGIIAVMIRSGVAGVSLSAFLISISSLLKF
ncbi:hypothetical protein U9M48_038332 [Paspalum notatum var. saurae]|uniref:KIB1-4 beta-propeller domain-containing protein n=1 Tax=Paspalum notatum var. saurae TaxID=547442 RepID=A0AAQ3UHS4_PASNO